jgi:hypothetical protein
LLREELAYKKRIYYANKGVMLKNLSKMEFDVDIETNLMTDGATLHSNHDSISVRGSMEQMMSQRENKRRKHLRGEDPNDTAMNSQADKVSINSC